MDQQGETAADAGRASAAQRTACRVLVAVSFYKNEQLVAPLVGALIDCAADLAAVGASVVFYNDSPGYAPLAAALDDWVARGASLFACRLENNPANLGFVRTMNRAVAAAVALRADLLLLNSDTVMVPGALPEMVAVAALDHMIGFVNPRSNNATLATLPLRAPPAGTGPAALRAWQALAEKLPRVSYVPTAVGFCLLVRWAILAEFGGFDEIYGQGYNEENDLVMRAGRCGYRAVLANHAFVWHQGEASFASAEISRDGWEPTNRAILDARYPEYSGYTLAHYSAPETLAEHLLAATLPDADGRLDIAFDFSSFRAAHNGTFAAGRQLLRVAREIWGPGFRVHVLCVPEVYEFHDYAALGVPRADPHGGRRFAVVFRVGQPYDWNVLERLAPAAAVLGVYMLDTISLDCPQLASPLLYDIWHLTLEHADLIAVQSRQTAAQFQQRFKLPAGALELVCPHGLDRDEYRLPGATGGAAPGAGRILVLGNHFHHKYLHPTANALAAAFPAREIVALGPNARGARHLGDATEPVPLARAPNLRIVELGKLADDAIGAAYDSADIVVFPSHAEGFGFPLLHALAARRPVFVRRLPVFEELWHAQGDTPNVHFFDTTAQLIDRLRDPPVWQDEPPLPPGNGTERAARQIRDALGVALGRVDYQRIVRRIRAVQLTSALAAPPAMPAASDGKVAEAARYFALGVERMTLRILRLPGAYAAIRVLFHGMRVAVRRLPHVARRRSTSG
jgi:GT2 family glycosyltransferase/glycosyltransferase involved in cell wall biosynthesis